MVRSRAVFLGAPSFHCVERLVFTTVPTEEQGAAEEEEADEERKTSLSEEDFNTVWKAIVSVSVIDC